MPVKFTVCGLPKALSEMLTAAARAPMAAGMNWTLIVQLPFTATELPQVLVTVKSPGFVPVVVMLAMLRTALPVLVRVTDFVALVVPRFWPPKLSDPTERLTAGPLPVPVKATVCGLPGRLSAMLTAAARAPGTVGENFTRIVQLAFCARLLPHVLVSEKSAGFAPVILMLVMVKLALPVFVKVTVWEELVVPTF